MVVKSDVDPDSMGSLDPYPDPNSQSGSGSSSEKRPTNIEKIYKFHFLKTECSLLMAEGFSCSLDISKLQLLIKKIF